MTFLTVRNEAELWGSELVFTTKPMSLEPREQIWARSVAGLGDGAFAYTYHSGKEEVTKQVVLRLNAAHRLEVLQEPRVIASGFSPFVSTVSTVQRDEAQPAQGHRLFTFLGGDQGAKGRGRLCGVNEQGLPDHCQDVGSSEKEVLAVAATLLSDQRVFLLTSSASGVPYYTLGPKGPGPPPKKAAPAKAAAKAESTPVGDQTKVNPFGARRVRWRTLNSAEGTVFHGLGAGHLRSDTAKMLNEVFTVVHGSSGRSSFVPKSAGVCLLDRNRAQQLAIVFRRSPVPLQKLCSALLTLDFSLPLGDEELEGLIQAWPTKADFEEVPRSEARLRLLRLSRSLDGLDRLLEQFVLLRSACEELLNSETLKRLLDEALIMGNYINGDAGCGFSLDAFSQLKSLKALRYREKRRSASQISLGSLNEVLQRLRGEVQSVRDPKGRAAKGCVDRLDSNDNLDEELLHFRMLQVSAEVLPKDHVNLERSDAPVPRRGYVVPHHSSRPRLSLAHWLTGAAEEKLLPFATAVLLPHAVAFLVAQVLMRRHGGTAVEVLQEKKEAPKSLSYIIKQAGPMWIIHLVAIFTFAAAAPSVEYLYLNYFARQSQPGIDCSVQMAAAPCTQSVTKVLKLQIIRGFVLPVVQFILGPALGAMSDAFGRRPAVLVIRTCLLISATGTMLVAWFPLPIWVDYALGVFSTVPWGAVPFAWYIDRFDHAPTIVYAVSLIEGSCIISEALGTAFGSFLSLNMAISVLFVGRAVTFCLALWVLPESLPEEKRMVFSWSSLMPTAALQALLQSPLVEKLTAILVINSFHWAGYYTIFGRFLQSHMAWARQNSYYSGLAEQEVPLAPIQPLGSKLGLPCTIPPLHLQMLQAEPLAVTYEHSGEETASSRVEGNEAETPHAALRSSRTPRVSGPSGRRARSATSPGPTELTGLTLSKSPIASPRPLHRAVSRSPELAPQRQAPALRRMDAGKFLEPRARQTRSPKPG
eukprot:g16698.t1